MTCLMNGQFTCSSCTAHWGWVRTVDGGWKLPNRRSSSSGFWTAIVHSQTAAQPVVVLTDRKALVVQTAPFALAYEYSSNVCFVRVIVYRRIQLSRRAGKSGPKSRSRDSSRVGIRGPQDSVLGYEEIEPLTLRATQSWVPLHPRLSGLMLMVCRDQSAARLGTPGRAVRSSSNPSLRVARGDWQNRTRCFPTARQSSPDASIGRPTPRRPGRCEARNDSDAPLNQSQRRGEAWAGPSHR